ncbi:MAG: hypothetical protein ACE5HO_09435 [bacterium]
MPDVVEGSDLGTNQISPRRLPGRNDSLGLKLTPMGVGRINRESLCLIFQWIPAYTMQE